jgi:type I restriction enzyme R subunit
MLKYAQEIGWEYVAPDEALRLRGGDKGLYFVDVLESYLLRLNKGIVDLGRAGWVIHQLNLLKPNI